MIFLGFFPKELIYRKTLTRASKFKGKADYKKSERTQNQTFLTRNFKF